MHKKLGLEALWGDFQILIRGNVKNVNRLAKTRRVKRNFVGWLRSNIKKSILITIDEMQTIDERHKNFAESHGV
ncbi:hypothetical protein RB2501_12899 [Robiginitalea biformata HTCC2501]|uniref:Uncharacterized protein n=1 Tax=Robiginitalea biformata (strain ATCC BAA-864 / DSM 15991 / KCTC 12146 / HTCC2501) TaxID=313596 RepID=A4CK27_ROBBH|nr:hypothetical protein RB2501_12899 [Robiginitalea biformata HTCC2501]